MEERLVRRFPGLVPLFGRFFELLPLRSALRRRLTRRFTQSGVAATNRGDVEVAFTFYHPDCISTFPPQLPTVGAEGGTHGREERIRFERRWKTEWGTIRYEPDEIIDLGSSFLILGRMTGGGLTSGAPIDTEWGVLYELSGGLAIREQVFFDRAEALKAAGL